MSDHRTALVPVKCWWYLSPELPKGKKDIRVDIGLLAEALIYYDRVFVEIEHYGVFNEVIAWFVRQNKLRKLWSLIEEGTIQFSYYSFIEAIGVWGDVHQVMLIDDTEESQTPSFEKNLFRPERLRVVLGNRGDRERLRRACEGRIIQIDSDACRASLENAQADFGDPTRAALLVQVVVDEIYEAARLGSAPTIRASVVKEGAKIGTAWNMSFEHPLIKMAKLDATTPLMGATASNRVLGTAARLGCDMYLGSPMSVVIGKKLTESSQRLVKSKNIIESLVEEVEFPDVRRLVNEAKIGLEEVLALRRHARRFRKWLDDERDRDRSTLVAYHSEVAREYGWKGSGRRALRLFGVLAGGAVPPLLGAYWVGLPGAVGGGIAGAGMGYLAEVASRLGEGWRPVVFGRWAGEWLDKRME